MAAVTLRGLGHPELLIAACTGRTPKMCRAPRARRPAGLAFGETLRDVWLRSLAHGFSRTARFQEVNQTPRVLIGHSPRALRVRDFSPVPMAERVVAV